MKTKDKKAGNIPGKNTEKNVTRKARPDYPHDVELDAEAGEDSASYSEEHDVTPPEPHEFPAFGNVETDFVGPSRHGRKTGRLVDHEPGL